MDTLYSQEPYKKRILHHIHCIHPYIDIFLQQKFDSNDHLCHKWYNHDHYLVRIKHKNVLDRMVGKIYLLHFSMWMVCINMKDRLYLVVGISLDMLSILIHLENKSNNLRFFSCIISKLYHWANIKPYICINHQQEFYQNVQQNYKFHTLFEKNMSSIH